MPVPLHTPRLNNNDDSVRLTHLFVSPGAYVHRGDPVADVETDKATFTVEAEQDGYLLGFCSQVGDSIEVGSVLAWMGASADEPLPVRPAQPAPPTSSGAPTLKAAILLARYGLTASEVPATGQRLSATDVERHAASRQLHRPAPAMPAEAGRRVPLTPPERGMLRTVAWHKSEAVPAYLEISFDPSRWNEHAAAFQQTHRLLLSPLLSLFAWRLVRIAAEQPALNATIVGEEKHLYDHVNLGFVVQSGTHLHVVVARQAEKMDEAAFVQRLGELQRSAMGNTLRPDETSGATIGFSSMARWAVTRHVPVLLPQTALMIAHSAPAGGAASLGATYDHRVLGGADVVGVLRALASPPEGG
jgi:pyruvate/2-oxoglutarate dehydrogenase complex dihydrolipoamide acyltransferase (E2) component